MTKRADKRPGASVRCQDMLHRLQGYNHRLARWERGLALGLLAMILLLGLAQICLRNVFARGIAGAEETQAHLVLWLGFVGASLATYEERHLRLDFLPRLLPLSWQPVLTLCTSLGAAIMCGLLCRAALTMVVLEYQAHTTLTIGIATWIAQSMIPVGFAVMGMRFALRALTLLLSLYQPRREA